MKLIYNTDSYLMELDGKVAELRAENDLTQESLSELLGCSVRTVSDVENGKVSPKITFILSLANCFDKDPEYFLPQKGDIKTCQQENKSEK